MDNVEIPQAILINISKSNGRHIRTYYPQTTKFLRSTKYPVLNRIPHNTFTDRLSSAC